MVYHPLEAGEFSCKEEIPEAACIAVVSPVRHGWHVGEDGVEGHQCLIVEAEVLRPHVNFLLAGGIPWHLTAERIGQFRPYIHALFHCCFQVGCHFVHSLCLQIIQDKDKDRSFHLAVLGIVRCQPYHCH